MTEAQNCWSQLHHELMSITVRDAPIPALVICTHTRVEYSACTGKSTPVIPRHQYKLYIMYVYDSFVQFCVCTAVKLVTVVPMFENCVSQLVGGNPKVGRRAVLIGSQLYEQYSLMCNGLMEYSVLVLV